MTIQQLMELYNMTIHELIEMIKLKGELIEKEDNVFPMVPAGAGVAEVILEIPK